tara:strand:+ start:252 stop:512 length:261 start_codon:yes stop_codon:yes gene_type:complete
LLRKEKIKMNDKRKKFVKYANLRLDNAIKHIQCLGNLQNQRQYEYSIKDVNAIEFMLFEAVNNTIKELKNPAKKKSVERIIPRRII